MYVYNMLYIVNNDERVISVNNSIELVVLNERIGLKVSSKPDSTHFCTMVTTCSAAK